MAQTNLPPLTQRRGLLAVLVFAVFALLAFVGLAFAAGYIIGKQLL